MNIAFVCIVTHGYHMNVAYPAGKTNAPNVGKSCLRRVHTIISYILKKMLDEISCNDCWVNTVLMNLVMSKN